MVTVEKPIPSCFSGFEHIRRSWDSPLDICHAKVLPGEFYVTPHRELISTVLGSCISACVRDPKTGMGGLNHFMLPNRTSVSVEAESSPLSAANRFGNFAMENLINALIRNGADRGDIEIKIFGGAHIDPSMSDVGANNIEFIRKYLATEGLRIRSEDVGGKTPRVVHFYSKTGKVRIKRLAEIEAMQVNKEEKAYSSRIVVEPPTGDIELF